MRFFLKISPISETVRDRAKRMKIWYPWGILHLVNMSGYFLEKVALAAILEFRKNSETVRDRAKRMKIWYPMGYTTPSEHVRLLFGEGHLGGHFGIS